IAAVAIALRAGALAGVAAAVVVARASVARLPAVAALVAVAHLTVAALVPVLPLGVPALGSRDALAGAALVPAARRASNTRRLLAGRRRLLRVKSHAPAPHDLAAEQEHAVQGQEDGGRGR